MNLLRTDYNYGPNIRHGTSNQGNIIRKQKKNKYDNENLKEDQNKDAIDIMLSPDTSYVMAKASNKTFDNEADIDPDKMDIEKAKLTDIHRTKLKIGDMIEGKENIEVAELILSPVIDQNSIAKNNINIILRSNTGIKEEVKIRDFAGKTVADLKLAYFQKEIKSILYRNK